MRKLIFMSPAFLLCLAMAVSCSDDDDDTYYVADEYATDYIDGHGAVDMGLSVMWASCNVGASSPSAYGRYFAWGEIKTKDEYTEDNSSYEGASMSDIAGYSSYDVATANWGDSWRMPTLDECQELIDRCTWEWATEGGHKGYLVTGPSGNSMFIPAGGWYYGSSLNYAGSSGNYWTGTVDDDDTQHSYSMDFSSDTYTTSLSYRRYGETIRPVSEEDD